MPPRPLPSTTAWTSAPGRATQPAPPAGVGRPHRTDPGASTSSAPLVGAPRRPSRPGLPGGAPGLLAAALLLLAAPALAHDVLVEAGPSLTAPTEADPRTGNLQARAEGTLEASDAWALFGTFQYTRDFGTRSQEVSATGSDVFLLGLGATWTPDEHWLATLSLALAPPSLQRNATAFTTAAGQTAAALVDSRAWSLGGLVQVGCATGVEAPLEATFDLVAGLTRYDVFQQLVLGPAGRAALVATCQAHPARPRCRLLSGAATPLLQGRLGASATVTLGEDTDLGLAVDGYLYDQDPAAVGYFSLVSLGRVELGTGVPLQPLALSVKPSLLQRLDRFTLKATYQLGLYVAGLGTTHALTVKVSWRASEEVTLWLSATGQVDVAQGAAVDPGGSALAGTLIRW